MLLTEVGCTCRHELDWQTLTEERKTMQVCMCQNWRAINKAAALREAVRSAVASRCVHGRCRCCIFILRTSAVDCIFNLHPPPLSMGWLIEGEACGVAQPSGSETPPDNVGWSCLLGGEYSGLWSLCLTLSIKLFSVLACGFVLVFHNGRPSNQECVSCYSW